MPADTNGASMFETTKWSLVARAGSSANGSQKALESLCQIYRPAVVKWFLYQGLDADAADDLTQGFFAKLLEGKLLSVADSERGRFRTFLSSSLRNFYYHQLEKEGAQKRGGGAKHVAYEHTLQGTHDPSPEQVFDQQFAKVAISQALRKLSTESKKARKPELFEHLQHYLIESPDAEDYARLEIALNMRRNTIAVAVHRLRKRLRELTREVLLETVSDKHSLDAELQALKLSARKNKVS